MPAAVEPIHSVHDDNEIFKLVKATTFFSDPMVYSSGFPAEWEQVARSRD